MLNSSAGVSISIASLLFIANISDARSIKQESIHYAAKKNQSHLIAKQSKSNASNLSAADIKGIHKALSEYFGELNDRQDPTIDQNARHYKMNGISQKFLGAEYMMSFIEVKKIELISISTDDKTMAKVELDLKTQNYRASRDENQSQQWIFKKDYTSNGGYTKGETIQVEKHKGSWRVYSYGVTVQSYKDTLK